MPWATTVTSLARCPQRCNSAHTCTHTYTHALTYKHMHVYTHAHTHVCAYTRTRTHIRTNTCVHMYMHTHAQEHTHARTCPCTHTWTQTYIQLQHRCRYLWLREHHMRKLAQIDGEMPSRSYRYTAEPRLDLQLAGYSWCPWRGIWYTPRGSMMAHGKYGLPV